MSKAFTKFEIVVGVLFLIVGTASLFVLSFKVKPSSQNRLIETVFDAGVVQTGDVIEHRFTLKNDSDIPLEIKEVISSCSCTTSDISQGKVISAGSSTGFSVSFHTQGLAGEQSNFILIKTNHPKTPEHLFVLSCKIKESFSYAPKQIDFGNIGLSNNENEKVITLWDSQFENLELTNIEADSPFLLYDIKKIIGTEKDGNRSSTPGFRVRIKLSPEVPKGLFSGSLKIKTNSTANSEIMIPVSAMIQSPIYSQPSRLAFGILTKDSPAFLDVTLCTQNNEPLNNVVLKCELDFIQCERILSEENQYRVTIDFDRAPKQKAVSSQISIAISNITVTIPLSFYLDGGTNLAH